MRSTPRTDESVDLRDVSAALRHGARWVAAGAVVGLLMGIVLTVVVPPSYSARASVLLRTGETPVGLLAGSRDGGTALGGLMSTMIGGSGFETELEILQSESVIGSVVDSLGLQVEVRRPHGTRVGALFSAVRVPHEAGPAEVTFRRAGDGYRVDAPGFQGEAAPGVPVRVAGAELTLRHGPLPERITVRLVDRPAAIQSVERKLNARRAAGEVAELRFTARDPATAAAVPNLLVDRYMALRRGTDRGVNQQRYEFLEAQTESVAVALRVAETLLRDAQERTGVIDPEVHGKLEIERAMQVRGQLEEVYAEAEALRRIVGDRQLTSRQMATYPTLLRNATINGLLNRMLELESQRTQLLERRTEADPDVLQLDRAIAQLDGDVKDLSSAYLAGLRRQEAELRSTLARYDATLGGLPAHAEENHRLQREVQRLGETLVAMQTQLVQTRLAAIGEGGNVRQLDAAVPPRRPSFPIPLLNVVGGLLGGVFFGMVGALLAHRVQAPVRETWQAELAAGIPAYALRPAGPVLLGPVAGVRTVVVLPVGSDTSAVDAAERLAVGMTLQGERVALALTAGAVSRTAGRPAALLPPGEAAGTESEGGASWEAGHEPEAARVLRIPRGSSASEVRSALAELEARFDRVVVALGGLDGLESSVVLRADRGVVLSADPARLRGPELEVAAATLRGLGIEPAAVLLAAASPLERADR